MAEATLEGPSLSMLHVSVPSEEVGQQIAGALVEGRLAACVNIIPGGVWDSWGPAAGGLDPAFQV